MGAEIGEPMLGPEMGDMRETKVKRGLEEKNFPVAQAKYIEQATARQELGREDKRAASMD